MNNSDLTKKKVQILGNAALSEAGENIYSSQTAKSYLKCEHYQSS